jgi:hypothetical protein
MCERQSSRPAQARGFRFGSSQRELEQGGRITTANDWPYKLNQ